MSSFLRKNDPKKASVKIGLGTDSDDHLEGGRKNDVLLSGNGADVLQGRAGNDILISGKGDDTLKGGGGNDALSGGKGDDLLLGGVGSDTLFGGNGNDRLNGGVGNDLLRGGKGFDRFLFSEAFGNDTISDFDAGNRQEKIVLRNLGMFSLEDVLAVASVERNGLVIRIGDNSITLLNVRADELVDANFRFINDIPNSAPLAEPDFAVTNEGQSLTVPAESGVLSNDSDAEGGALRVVAVGGQETSLATDVLGSNGGIFNVRPDGSFVFVAGESFRHLSEGEISETTISYTAADVDGAESVSTLTVRVIGINAAPEFLVTNQDETFRELVETDSGLSVVGTLSITDVDLNDSVSVEVMSVSVSGPTDISAERLNAMLSIDINPVVAGGSATGTFSWTFDSGDEAFDHLEDGEVLTLEYLLTATDSAASPLSATQALRIVITGTQDVPVVQEGVAVDGYILGATVFGDANANGLLDEGEVSTVTDSSGNFTLVDATGTLVLFGGTDISTGIAFQGTLKAPQGSSAVTSLSTLVVQLMDQGLGEAQSIGLVRDALGLPGTLDLLNLDPVAATLAFDPDGEAMMAALTKVQNTVRQIGAVLNGAGAADGLGAAYAAVASALVVEGIDLDDAALVEMLIGEAAALATVSGAAIDASLAGASQVIAESNQAVTTAVGLGNTGDAFLVDLAQVNVVAQELASPALEAAVLEGSSSAIDAVVAEFTGQALQDLIIAAENDVGDVDGGIDGTNENDTIDGTINGEALSGLGGDDLIQGDAGADVLVGGIGNDQLFGGSGNDALLGGLGDDQLNGGIGNDNLQGGFGDDQIFDDAGDDLVDAGDGADNINVGQGSDTILAGAGDDTVQSSASINSEFEDVVTSSTRIDGGDGNDFINFGASLTHNPFFSGLDTEPPIGGVTYALNLLAGAGDDIVEASVGTFGNVSALVIVDGGDGNDRLQLSDVTSSNSGSNLSFGTDGITLQVLGGNGEDHITLRLGDIDQNVTLGADRDVLDLRRADEFLADRVEVQAIVVQDFVAGQNGDVIDINDLTLGFSGWDGASNPFGAGFLRLAQVGTDTVLQMDSDGGGDAYRDIARLQNTVLTDLTADNFSPAFPPDGSGIFGITQIGTNLPELLEGSIGDDVVTGLDGSDTLEGGNGNDQLDGGAGPDTLSGGFGNDTLTGGAGADTFRFDLGSGTDTVRDFEAGLLGDDVLDLSSYGLDFGTLVSAAQDNLLSGNLELTLSQGDRLILESVLLADLDVGDIIF